METFTYTLVGNLGMSGNDIEVGAILILGGMVFLLLAIGAHIKSIGKAEHRVVAGIIGVSLLLAGLALELLGSVTDDHKPHTTLVPTTTSPPIYVLENFESARQMKWWTPDTKVFDYRETSEQAHGGAQSFKVKYNKTDTYQYIGAEVPSGFCDFAQGHTLQMWVYGKVVLLLKLEDQNLRQVDISEQRVTEATGWTLLSFDFTGAGKDIDLSKIRTVFLFPATGDTSASGEFLIDDIAVNP